MTGNKVVTCIRLPKVNQSFFFLCQYCLEDDVNFLDSEDWIIHLDEETLLTENSVKGILNFITNNKGCRYVS